MSGNEYDVQDEDDSNAQVDEPESSKEKQEKQGSKGNRHKSCALQKNPLVRSAYSGDWNQLSQTFQTLLVVNDGLYGFDHDMPHLVSALIAAATIQLRAGSNEYKMFLEKIKAFNDTGSHDERYLFKCRSVRFHEPFSGGILRPR